MFDRGSSHINLLIFKSFSVAEAMKTENEILWEETENYNDILWFLCSKVNVTGKQWSIDNHSESCERRAVVQTLTWLLFKPYACK